MKTDKYWTFLRELYPVPDDWMPEPGTGYCSQCGEEIDTLKPSNRLLCYECSWAGVESEGVNDRAGTGEKENE
jgi:hypothetical protein